MHFYLRSGLDLKVNNYCKKCIFILVLVQPKVVITHFDLWNQTPNQDMEWTP